MLHLLLVRAAVTEETPETAATMAEAAVTLPLTTAAEAEAATSSITAAAVAAVTLPLTMAAKAAATSANGNKIISLPETGVTKISFSVSGRTV